MKYLLDTSTCIDLIRRRQVHLIERIARLPAADFSLSSIVVAELQYGVEKSPHTDQDREALEEFLVPFTLLDFDYQATLAYGKIRAVLTAAGTPIGAMDMLIAAQALSRNLILLTGNLREFQRVPGLAAEDWTKP